MSYDLDETQKENEARREQMLEELARGRGPTRLRTKRARLMCGPCGEHAYARAVCVICAVGLCKRHTHMHEGKTYCKIHVPRYETENAV